MDSSDFLPGGGFILRHSDPSTSYSPEDFTSEQRQIAETTAAFVRDEILPELEKLEQQDFALMRDKLRRCAELGLFLVDIPEAYGGLELDKATSLLVAETIGPSGCFAITSSGQTGIGSLPLVYYGSAAQKEKYLGKLTSGDWIGAYCLTEPDAGSDPLSARTRAQLTADGRHYRLNGVKQFITNAAFAQLFTMFAKIDGRHFSAFLVERDLPGLSIGSEEKKMGLKGTSTAQVVLEDVLVPVENLLGEAGKGHKIAFNVLNIGRLKLAATALGAAKAAFGEAARYACERKQFGAPLASFGAIREKLGQNSPLVFAAESLLYRIGGLLDQRLAALSPVAADDSTDYQQQIEEYAGECALAKVFCSETLAQVADEAVQIHGGYGYMHDYPVERYYRDQRINRIFEGTNEINRLFISTLLLRRAQQGRLPAWHSARIPATEKGSVHADGLMELEFALLVNLKKAFLLLIQQADAQLAEQEILLALADIAIAVFALESSLLRLAKMHAAAGSDKQQRLLALARGISFDLSQQVQNAARRALCYVGRDAQLEFLLDQLHQLTRYPVAGLLEARRLLADHAVAVGGYKV